MFDLGKMMGKMKEMQEQMKVIQEEIGKQTLTAETGGGMVKVTVNGKRQIIKLEIDDDLMTPADKEMLQDLISSATNKALADMEEIIKEEMAKQTQGMLPNIPGLDLNAFRG